jgi:hypothetical protein
LHALPAGIDKGALVTKLTVDTATLAKLHNLDGLFEVCDESGRTLGYFHPLVQPGAHTPSAARSPFTDEEIQQRRQQRTGRPLAEILEKLRQS